MAALIVLAILIGAFAPLDANTTTPPAEKSAIGTGIETTEKLVATTAQPTTQTETEMTDKLVSTAGKNEETSTTQAQPKPTEVTTTRKLEEMTMLKKFVITCTPNGGQVGAEPFIRPAFVVIVTYLAMLAV